MYVSVCVCELDSVLVLVRCGKTR